MNVASPTTSKGLITTIQMRNTIFTKISYSHQTSASYFLQWSQQHLIPNKPSLHFQILGWSSWYIQTYRCEAVDLWITWGWIQTKDVHSFYNFQVVFNGDDVRITLTKSWKWVTRSSVSVIPILQIHQFFFACSHFKATQRVFIKGL